MRTLIIRSISGIVFVALMVGGILWNQYSYAVLMSLLLAGALNEYYKITIPKREILHVKLQAHWLVIALSLFIYWRAFILASPPFASIPGTDNLFIVFVGTMIGLRDSNLPMNEMFPLFIFILFAYELFTKSEKPFENIGWNVVAVCWILIPVLLTNKIYFEKGGAFLVAVFTLIWLFDSACYVCGSLFGKHPLSPKISPKKTIEGLAGGLFITLAAAYFFNKCPSLSSLSGIEWVVLAFITSIAATFGDLVESLLKRSLNIKDSGNIMPGHGGFLDRFDAYFFAVPFVVATLWGIAQFQNVVLIFDFLNK